MAPALDGVSAASAAAHSTVGVSAASDADASSTSAPAAPRKKRSVDYLLEGESVKANRHLARFAAAPFLPLLLREPAFGSMLSRTSKALRKEIIEAYVVIESLEALARGPGLVVDLCSGKGFSSVLLALERPELAVLMVDSDHRILLDHVDALPNVRFVRADICAPGFGAALDAALGAAAAASSSAAAAVAAAADAFVAAAAPAASAPTVAADSAASPPSCVLVGVHLCGQLSPRAVELFAAAPALDALLLVPCCLDKRFDATLKAEARAARRDPYDAKVEQLAALMAEVCDAVSCVRDAEMRTASGTASEGAAAAKNAVLIGRRRAGVELGACEVCEVGDG